FMTQIKRQERESILAWFYWWELIYLYLCWMRMDGLKHHVTSSVHYYVGTYHHHIHMYKVKFIARISYIWIY
ncbi:hypothetical protein ACJX0J_024508, partial [Zea mays]